MIDMRLSQKGRRLNVLCLGAHCDDIEIGCGGTVLKLIQEYGRTSFGWIVFSSNEIRRKEAERSAAAFLADADRNVVIVNKFRDGFFPYSGAEIKDYFEGLKRGFDPDLILTHNRQDLHQDHRLISEITWNTFRDHLILEYEIPKYDGDMGAPNVFVHLDGAIWKKKVGLILKCFKSQASNQWFAQEAFQAIMRLRGVECNSPSQYAEAFYCRKLVLA